MVLGIGIFPISSRCHDKFNLHTIQKRRIGRFTTPKNRLPASCKSQYMLADSHVHSSSVRTFSRPDSYQVEVENDPNSH